MTIKRSPRPVLQLSLTPLDRVLRVVALLSLLGLFIVTIWGLATLPDVIPVHFGLDGQPDRWGNKASLLILPIIYIGLYALLSFFAGKPHLYNYPGRVTEENALRLYRLGRQLMEIICAEALLIGLVIQWMIVESARSYNASFVLSTTVVIVGVLIVTVVIYMLKLRRAARS